MRKMLVIPAALLLCFTFSTPAFAARHKVPVFSNKETTVEHEQDESHLYRLGGLARG